VLAWSLHLRAFPLFAAFLAGAPATAAPGRPAPQEPAVAEALEAGLPAGGARASAATRPLLGAPYATSPLGEGVGPDPDPRFRLDAFDCQTFAETALALGSAATLDEARRALDDVRYRAEVELGDRLHEVVSQWIPSNLAKGWIVPLSREVAGPATVVAEVRYDAARWQRLALAGQRLPGVSKERLPIGRFEVEVAPAAALIAHEPSIPDGTLAFVVREERADRLTRVSHAGLVVVRDGHRLVRHASSWPALMRVVEEPLPLFLERQRRASSRPLTGLALFAIPDNRARVGRLPARP
jgi:Protein of unknown function (DUF1460)